MTASPRAFSPRRSILVAALLATGTGAAFAGSAQAALGPDGIPEGTELISKASGPSGLPFAAALATASPDGRFVLLRLGNAGSRPADPTGPEATFPAGTTYAVRDRTTDTTLAIPGSVEGRQVIFASDISDDGSRVVVGLLGLPDGVDGPTTDPFGGFAVLDRPSGKLLPLPKPAGLPATTKVFSAFLSPDGQTAVVSTTNASGTPSGIFRGPVGGTGTLVLDLPGATATETSADLSTILYRRALRPVASVLEGRGEFTANAYGIKQGSAAPRVVIEDTQDIAAVNLPDGECIDNPKTWTYTYAQLSDDGGRVGFGYNRSEYYASLPGGVTSGYITRSPVGQIERHENYASFQVYLQALGGTHEVSSFGAAYTKSSPVYFQRQFTKGDTELISSETGAGSFGPNPAPSRYTYAKPYELAGTSAAPAGFTPDNEPVDTADRVSHSVDAGCTPTPVILPVGTLGQYADLTLLTPISASKSLGAIKFTSAPSGVRPAVSVQAELKVFGISLWKRTIGGDREFALPKPLWLLPQVLEITVQPADSQDGHPAPLTKRIPIRALKY